MKRFYFILIALFFSFQLISQQNPPNILWKNIETEHFNIIFPKEITPSAQIIANTLEWVSKYDTLSLKANVKPLSVLLFNQSNTSNAYAALMPRRMAWYLTPPQTVENLGSTDWAQNLAIHEYRHIVQYQKNKQHFTKFITFFFGDVGQNMMRWSIPDWFFEGDAICVETALSNGGRGRIPAFSMYIRNYLLENEHFTYNQAYLRSFKRYYPNHYYLGYPLAAYARVEYGADIWDKVLERTNKYSFWPFAFNRSLKKYTGLNINKFYNTAMSDLKTEWTSQDENIKPTEFKTINNTKKRSWTNYYNPQYDENGNIICQKESLDKISAFYKFDKDGNQEKLTSTDASYFNYSNNKIVWTRTIPDLRWGEKEFTDIFIYDLNTKKEKRLTYKAKYMSPALSPDGSKIAVVEHLSNQQTHLVIINIVDSTILNKTQVGDNDYIRTPTWSKDGKSIAFTHAKFNGSALSVFDLKSEKIKQILPYSFENIGRPVFYKNFIIYNSPFSGIGDIYAVNINTKEKFRVVSSKYGAYNPAISKDLKKISYQNYNKSGFDIVEIDIDENNWEKIDAIEIKEQSYSSKLAEQETNGSIFDKKIPNEEYQVTDYKKYKDAINIHSWGIYPNTPYIDIGIMSKNYLNTLEIIAGYLYNYNEKTNGGYLGFAYSKYYPVFSAISQYNQRIETYRYNGQFYTDEWNEYRINSGFSLPFNFSRGIYTTTMSVGGGAEYTYVKGKEIRTISESFDGNFTPLFGNFSFNHLRQKAWRDFNPMFGQSINVIYKKIMDYDDYEGYIFSSKASLYFPGILPHNSIKLSGAYEEQLTYNSNNQDIYYFSSQTGFPRGYDAVTLDKLYKFSADYQLPLWYPDLSVGPLAYVKRIKLGAFYDYADGFLGNASKNFQSFGGNINFEFNLFRIKYDFDIGIQYAYRLEDNKYQISILLVGLPF